MCPLHSVSSRWGRSLYPFPRKASDPFVRRPVLSSPLGSGAFRGSGDGEEGDRSKEGREGSGGLPSGHFGFGQEPDEAAGIGLPERPGLLQAEMKAPVGGGDGSLLPEALGRERLPQRGEPAAEGTVPGAGGKDVPALEKEAHALLKGSGGPLHDAARERVNVHPGSVRIHRLFPNMRKKKDASGSRAVLLSSLFRPGSVDLSFLSL
uniref:Uncharacterized protein n=1 Tax=Leptospirillum ferrodiazotrophum TaxID=412449 RepID=C6HYR4_9BACT|nr:MAG: protein of unknown function [Leptospirillum ferrodiazotrophum]